MAEDRHRFIYEEFDCTSNSELYLLAFCKTLAEGVDTKPVNMMVFVDKPTSHVGLAQCIGRVQRKGSGFADPAIPEEGVQCGQGFIRSLVSGIVRCGGLLGIRYTLALRAVAGHRHYPGAAQHAEDGA